MGRLTYFAELNEIDIKSFFLICRQFFLVQTLDNSCAWLVIELKVQSLYLNIKFLNNLVLTYIFISVSSSYNLSDLLFQLRIRFRSFGRCGYLCKNSLSKN